MNPSLTMQFLKASRPTEEPCWVNSEHHLAMTANPTFDAVARCPNCEHRLDGMDSMLIEQCLDDIQATEWLVPCPRCGGTIGQDDLLI